MGKEQKKHDPSEPLNDSDLLGNKQPCCSDNFCGIETVTRPSKEKSNNRFERRHPDLSMLLKEMPPFVSRSHPRFKEWTGYTGRTMANLDCLQKTATVNKIMLGNTIAYERGSLIHWLEQRSFVIE